MKELISSITVWDCIATLALLVVPIVAGLWYLGLFKTSNRKRELDATRIMEEAKSKGKSSDLVNINYLTGTAGDSGLSSHSVSPPRSLGVCQVFAPVDELSSIKADREDD